MENTDWIQFWRELVERFKGEPAQSEKDMMARWAGRARSKGYTEEKRKRDWDDPLMRFVLSRLDPDDTVLDIGAGIGRWSIPTAMACKKVTALDALPGALEILRENAACDGVANIETVPGDWATADLGPHDYTLSSHAAYISPDIVGYARKMERLARKACYMVLRVPRHDGVIGELSRRIHGSRHDSPNFVVGYNALLQAGIYPHVVMENADRLWHNETLEEALSRAKRYLHVHSHEHDDVIAATLEKRLAMRDGEYWWPDWMRSALIWWHPDSYTL